MVVTSPPSAWTASTVQDLTASPSSSTVQAPQWLVSQPTWVPVRPSTSRRYWTSSSRGSTSCSWTSPLTLILTRTRESWDTEPPPPDRSGPGLLRPDPCIGGTGVLVKDDWVGRLRRKWSGAGLGRTSQDLSRGATVPPGGGKSFTLPLEGDITILFWGCFDPLVLTPQTQTELNRTLPRVDSAARSRERAVAVPPAAPGGEADFVSVEGGDHRCARCAYLWRASATAQARWSRASTTTPTRSASVPPAV